MKPFAVSSLVAVLAALWVTPALADEAQAPRTRAEVRAEYFQARRDGTLPMLDPEGRLIALQHAVTGEAHTRQEVRAEYFQARRDGTLPIMDPEGRLIARQQGAFDDGNTRQEVRQDYFEARREGALPVYDGQGRRVSPQGVMGGPPATHEPGRSGRDLK